MKFSASVISSVVGLLATANAASSAVCSDATVTTYSTTYIPYDSEATSSSSTSASSTSSASSSSSSSSSSASSTITSTVSSSVSSSSAAASSTSTGFDFASVYLAKHNYYRGLMQDTDDLVWNTDIQAIAQGYADDYTCDGTLTHSNNYLGDSELGENLGYGYDFEKAGVVTAWFNEISSYSWDDPGFSESTGHFTQLVWAETTDVGCGYKYCGDYYGYYVVCNYNPEGNLDLDTDVTYFYRLDVHEPIDSATAEGGFSQ